MVNAEICRVKNLSKGVRLDDVLPWDDHDVFVVSHRNVLALSKDIKPAR